MMRPMKTFTLIALAGLLSACTEEISEELKNSQNARGQSTTTDLSDSKITLKHQMDDRLSFSLHKAGTIDAPCEISPPDSNGFDASTYYRDPSMSPKPQVIDCILEAQEQDLYHAGAKFELKVDAQLCEYVSYSPFKFIERAFGSTSKTVYRFNCATAEDDCGTQGSVCDRVFDNVDMTSGNISAVNPQNSINYDDFSCQFDYTDSGGPNCDSGSVTVVDLIVENARYDHDNDANTDDVCPAPDAPVVYDGTSKDSCGGEHGACFGGPAIEHFSNEPYFTSTIYENTDLKEFVESWEVEAPEKRQSKGGAAINNNMYVANFSRICSDTSQTKVEDGTNYAVYNSLSLQGHHVENVAYDPNNLPYKIGSVAVNDSGGELDYFDMSENPWRSVYTMMPYYAFKCLDQAKDVKAQIRLFIREWDRSYEEPISTFAMVSDAGTVVPLIDSNGVHDDDPWNDYKDWDDHFATSDQFMFINNQCADTTSPFSPAIFPGSL